MKCDSTQFADLFRLRIHFIPAYAPEFSVCRKATKTRLPYIENGETSELFRQK